MSNYDFEVRLGTSVVGRRDIKTYNHEGQTFIEGRKGTEYVLTFKNNTRYPVEAVFSVDGLSVIDGKPAGVGSTGYIVRPYAYLEVPGWRIDDGRVAKFVFQPQGDKRDLTYVEALRADGINVDAGNQGVIGCMVFTEEFDGKALYRDLGGLGGDWPGNISYEKSRGLNIPTRSFASDNYSGSSRRVSLNSVSKGFQPQNSFTSNLEASASLGTGFGEDKAFRTQNVSFTRANPHRPAFLATVIYDTLAGLRKRGVPVDPAPNPVTNAFPNSPFLANDGCYVPRNRR